MKTFVTLVLFTITIDAFCQQETAKDSLYVITYTTGTLWDQSIAPADQPYFKDHSRHLSDLRKAGVIAFGARYADKGMIVIHAQSYIQAREIITNDLAIANNLFVADIQKLNVFYPGCIER